MIEFTKNLLPLTRTKKMFIIITLQFGHLVTSKQQVQSIMIVIISEIQKGNKKNEKIRIRIIEEQE